MLLNWVLNVADNDMQRAAALHMVSSILNRQVDGKEDDDLVDA